MKQIGDLLTQISSTHEFKLNKDSDNKKVWMFILSLLEH